MYVNVAARYVESMETVATAYFIGQTMEYPLGPDAATCAGLLNSYCPVLRGEVLRYKLRLFIERFMFVVRIHSLVYIDNSADLHWHNVPKI